MCSAYLCAGVKRVVAIACIPLLIVPSLGRFWMWVDFKLHQQMIEEVFCINRSRPELQCKGKCHLMRQYQEEEDSGGNSAPRPGTDRLEITYIPVQVAPGFPYHVLKRVGGIPVYDDGLYHARMGSDIFHPPEPGRPPHHKTV